MEDTIVLDVLVVGGGVGGLTVGAGLARAGYEVGVVERSDHIGGSGVLSEGYVWTAPDLDTFLREDPGGDIAKFAAMRAELEPALDEIAATGVEVGQTLTSVLGFGYGRQVDIAGYLRKAQRTVERAGGWVLYEHDVTSVATDGGRVTGASIRDRATNERVEVRARSVVIATGGFQGDSGLRARYLGEWTRDILLRANPVSDGGGIDLGLAAGGALSAGMDGFYGHLVPTPLDRWEAKIYTAVTQYHSAHGVLIDHGGRRFTDESAGDHVNAQEVAKVGTALLFIDDDVRRREAIGAPVPGMPAFDRVQDAVERGARVSVGADLETLVIPIAEWGFDRDRTLATLRESQHGDAGQKVPARFTDPPFVLMEVRPAITFTLGGLRTDVEGRVLDESGGPISGLWAAGVDSGGVNVRGYTGGLVRGITLGRVTARAIDASLAED